MGKLSGLLLCLFILSVKGEESEGEKPTEPVSFYENVFRDQCTCTLYELMYTTIYTQYYVK